MATCSSTLDWQIPRAEVPGGLQSMDSHRGGQDRAHTLHTPWGSVAGLPPKPAGHAGPGPANWEGGAAGPALRQGGDW